MNGQRERSPRAIVVFFCHDGHGNYVLHVRSPACRDEQGRWCPGGGTIEWGETAEQAVIREVSEEYGAIASEIQFLGHRELIDERRHIISLDHRVLVDPSMVRLMEPAMATDIGWFRISALPSPLNSAVPMALSRYKGIL